MNIIVGLLIVAQGVTLITLIFAGLTAKVRVKNLNEQITVTNYRVADLESVRFRHSERITDNECRLDQHSYRLNKIEEKLKPLDEPR